MSQDMKENKEKVTQSAIVTDVKPLKNEKEDDQLVQDLQAARIAQARMMENREAGPDGISIRTVRAKQREHLIKLHVPEAIEAPLKRGQKRQPGEFLKGITVRCMYGADDPQKHRAKIAEGWEPVTEVINGKRVQVQTSGGDLLYKRPAELTRDLVASSQRANQERLEQVHKEFTDSMEDDSAVNENESTVRKGAYQEI